MAKGEVETPFQPALSISNTKVTTNTKVEVTLEEKKQALKDKLEEVKEGRLESEINLKDPYWQLRAETQQALHELGEI